MTDIAEGAASTKVSAGEDSGFVWSAAHTVILLTVCAAQLLENVDVTIVNVALPKIQSGLDISPSNLQWIVNAYAVLFGGFLLLGGRVGDLVGKRRVFVSGVALFTVASFASGIASNAGILVSARAVQGFAAAFVSPMTLAIIATTFPEGAPRNKAFGVWGAITGISTSLGVTLGGVLTDSIGWRWIFFINIPVGLFIIIAALRYLNSDSGARTRGGFDAPGAFASTAGIGLLCYTFVQTNDHSWGSARTVVLLVVSVGLLAFFLVQEKWIAKEPLVPLTLFANRSVTGANIVAVLVGSGLLAMFYFISLYEQEVLHYSALKTGISYLPLTFTLTACAFLAPMLIPKVGIRWTLVLGCAVAVVGLVLFARVGAEGGLWSDVIGPSLVVSPGLALTFIPMTLAAVAGVAMSQTGVASGLVNSSRTAGSALGLAVIVTLATSRTNHLLSEGQDTANSLTGGFRLGFAISAGLMAAAAIASLLLFSDGVQAEAAEASG